MTGGEFSCIVGIDVAKRAHVVCALEAQWSPPPQAQLD